MVALTKVIIILVVLAIIVGILTFILCRCKFRRDKTKKKQVSQRIITASKELPMTKNPPPPNVSAAITKKALTALRQIKPLELRTTPVPPLDIKEVPHPTESRPYVHRPRPQPGQYVQPQQIEVTHREDILPQQRQQIELPHRDDILPQQIEVMYREDILPQQRQQTEVTHREDILPQQRQQIEVTYGEDILPQQRQQIEVTHRADILPQQRQQIEVTHREDIQSQVLAEKERRYQEFNRHYQQLIDNARKREAVHARKREAVQVIPSKDIEIIDERLPKPEKRFVSPVVPESFIAPLRDITEAPPRRILPDSSFYNAPVQPAGSILLAPHVPSLPTNIPRSTPPYFTVVSYNIRVDVDKPPHNWTARSQHVLNNIKQVNPDVICLQESSPKVKSFMSRAFQGWHAVGSYRGSQSFEAVYIFLNSQIWEKPVTHTYILTEGGPVMCPKNNCTQKTQFGGIKDKYPRIFTYAKTTHIPSGLKLHLLNTHLSLDPAIQSASIKQLVRFIKNKIPLLEPVIFSADMNSHYAPSDVTTPLSTFLTAAQFQDTLDLVDNPTFGDFSSVHADKHRLDYILFRPTGIICTSANISSYRYGVNNYRPSDHEMLYARFQFV